VSSLSLLRPADGSARTYIAPTASLLASGNTETLALRVTSEIE